MKSDKELVERLEFAFRAWDTRGEIMIYPSPQMNQLYITLDGRLVEIDREGDEVPARHYIILVCTGLRDRTGKKIYEGDIIQRHPARKYQPFTVEWDREMAGFDLSASAQVDYEVIGNVYERLDHARDN